MNTDATSLDRLHDIVVPAPVPWWPPAPGWYWVLALALLLLLTVLWKGLARWQHNRYRREAMAELARQQVALKNPETRASALFGLAELVRRTALTAFPRERVAALTGGQWFEFLDRTGAGRVDFRDSLGLMLESAVYDPRAAGALTEQQLRALVHAIRDWIEHHDAELEPQNAIEGGVEPSVPLPGSIAPKPMA